MNRQQLSDLDRYLTTEPEPSNTAAEIDLVNALECLQTAVDAAYGPHSIRATNTTIRAYIDRGTTDTVRVDLGAHVSIVGDTIGNIAVVLHAVTDMDSYDAHMVAEHMKRASDIVHALEMAW